LHVVRCDVANPTDVHDAVAGHDAVLCALGADSWGPTALYSTAARNVVLAMRGQGARRLVFLSNFGVQDEQARGTRQAALLFLARRVLRHTLADHRLALEEIGGSPLAWTAVRPLAMSDGPLTGRYRVETDGLLPPGGARVSRADVAHFMLRQAVEDEFLNSAPAIAY
jgi:putative NADH-flavin reductase